MSFETIRLELENGVATVWLHRPQTRNLLDPVMFAELARVFHELDQRDDVRAIVLTGSGDHFSAGADLSGGAAVFQKESFARFEALTRDAGSGALELDPQTLSTPVIAAVNGTAAGGGLTLALQCDLILVAADATLALPFTRRGLVAERNAHWNLQRQIGPQRTADLLLTGRKFNGSEAAEMGLALRALPKGRVLAEAVELARSIADHTAPAAVASTKRLLQNALREPDSNAARRLEREVFQTLGAGPDCAEALAAHQERRAPRWVASKADLPAPLRR